MSETYIVTQLEPNRFQIAGFGDSAAPDGVYETLYTKTRDWMSCNCRGFRMQKDKSEHRHCKMVRWWIGQGKPDGVAIWEESGEYKMNKFVEV